MTALQQSFRPSFPEALQQIYMADAFSCAVDLDVDARGLACPMPLLKAKQGLRQLAIGQRLRLLATDSGSLKDIVAFSQMTGHGLAAFAEEADAFCYIIVKG